MNKLIGPDASTYQLQNIGQGIGPDESTLGIFAIPKNQTQQLLGIAKKIFSKEKEIHTIPYFALKENVAYMVLSPNKKHEIPWIVEINPLLGEMLRIPNTSNITSDKQLELESVITEECFKFLRGYKIEEYNYLIEQKKVMSREEIRMLRNIQQYVPQSPDPVIDERRNISSYSADKCMDLTLKHRSGEKIPVLALSKSIYSDKTYDGSIVLIVEKEAI